MLNPHLVTPTMRLLVLLAKVRVSPADLALANALVGEMDRWEDLIDLAAQNFSLPLLRRHVDRLDATVPGDVRDAIRAGGGAYAFQNLQTAAALHTFSRTCLEPLGVEGLFFKGISIGLRHYGDLSLRPTRDVDVLVPPKAYGTVLRRAAAEGYAIVTPDGVVRPLATERDIRAVLRFSHSATLYGQDGMVVDLQRTLDQYSGIFSSLDPFEAPATFSLGGKTFKTLSDDLLFNYICHHHARHVWSRLYWFSDIDAIAGADDFDEEVALAMARRIGQSGTVEASLELRSLMASPSPWTERTDLPRGLQFLDLALRNLSGSIALEKQIAFRMVGGEFMFNWQARPDLVRRARRQWWQHTLRPTLREYHARPLPDHLQWLYIFPRALDLARQSVVRRK